MKEKKMPFLLYMIAIIVIIIFEEFFLKSN